MKKKTKIALYTLAGVLIIIAILIGFSVWAMRSHGFNMEEFNHISQGMTKLDVQKKLGKPFSTTQTEEGATLWHYGNNLKWCMAVIRFDSRGKLESKVHDH